MIEQTTSKELVLAKKALIKQHNSLDILPADPESRIKFLEHIAKGANTGVQTVGDAILLVATAQELGIGLGAAMRNINVIKGKVTLNYHILKSLLARHSNIISYERTVDYQPVYLYVTADNMKISGIELPKNVRIVPLTALKELSPNGIFNVATFPEIIDGKPTGRPVILDYYTEYTFKRVIPDIENPGKTKIKTIVSRYTLNQATTEGVRKEGGAWDTRSRTMVDKSAFVFGARDIADDIFSGMYAPFEFGTVMDDTIEVEEVS